MTSIERYGRHVRLWCRGHFKPHQLELFGQKACGASNSIAVRAHGSAHTGEGAPAKGSRDRGTKANDTEPTNRSSSAYPERNEGYLYLLPWRLRASKYRASEGPTIRNLQAAVYSAAILTLAPGK